MSKFKKGDLVISDSGIIGYFQNTDKQGDAYFTQDKEGMAGGWHVDPKLLKETSLRHPLRGKWVMVRDKGGEWEKRVFLEFRGDSPWVVCDEEEEEEFFAGRFYQDIYFQEIKEIEDTPEEPRAWTASEIKDMIDDALKML